MSDYNVKLVSPCGKNMWWGNSYKGTSMGFMMENKCDFMGVVTLPILRQEEKRFLSMGWRPFQKQDFVDWESCLSHFKESFIMEIKSPGGAQRHVVQKLKAYAKTLGVR